MNRLIMTPIALSLLTFGLAGCGEGEDAIFGSSNSNNDLTISSFDNSYDNKANASAIARIDWSYRTGAREVQTTNIINNYSNQSLNNLDSVVLADSFEGTLDNKYIEVDNRTVKRPIYEKNSNRKLNLETRYNTLNLSGLKANSYIAGSTLNQPRGIVTALNNYPNISSNVAFPTGSVCYIPVTTSEVSFLSFNGKNKTGYSSLNKWINAAEKRFSDNRQSITSSFGVGLNNRQSAAQVRFLEFREQPAYVYNGVEYGSSIYEAEYVAKGITEPNTDSRQGVVDCTLVNDVAADFLEREIKRYY